MASRLKPWSFKWWELVAVMHVFGLYYGGMCHASDQTAVCLLTSDRGYLNLMLIPRSEMRLTFADDAGAVERVAVTIPGVESGGILIEELKEDTSQRTFLVKDGSGNITNYFWQAEKHKNTGDELITKIRNTLKRPPTIAHLTGIDEGRLDSFAAYLQAKIISKALSQKANPTQPEPSLESNEESDSSSTSSQCNTEFQACEDF